MLRTCVILCWGAALVNTAAFLAWHYWFSAVGAILAALAAVYANRVHKYSRATQRAEKERWERLRY